MAPGPGARQRRNALVFLVEVGDEEPRPADDRERIGGTTELFVEEALEAVAAGRIVCGLSQAGLLALLAARRADAERG